MRHEHGVKAIRDSAITAPVVRDGGEVVASTPEEFGRTISTEVALWGKVARKMGIKSA